jgi:hypothetical protein
MLHGISSLFYLIESLLGVVLIWKLPLGEGAGSVQQSAPGVSGKVTG